MVSSKSEPAGVVEEAGKAVKPTATQKVTRSPSLAKPDYGVYHTKKSFKDAVQKLVDSCSALTMEMVSYAAEDDPSYVANMSVVTYTNTDTTTDDDRLHVLLDFGEHGRELISSEVGLGFLTSLCDDAYRQSIVSTYNLDEKIVDDMVIHVIPMENEHGRDMVEGGHLCERKNGRGVDPNRNWPVDWGKKEPDYDPSEEYPGLKPFSEPEAVALREIVAAHSPDVFINIHSGMEALFVPYDHRREIPYSEGVNATLNILNDLNTKFCNGSCSVGSGGANVGYLAHGTATDYIHQEMHVPITMTWEIYGDFSAAYEDCFRSFNPVERADVGIFIDRWVASVLYFLQRLPQHPSTRARMHPHQYHPDESSVIVDTRVGQQQKQKQDMVRIEKRMGGADGNFINAIVQLKRGDIESQLRHFLGDACRIYTTRCCIHELKSMGPDLAEARKASKQLRVHQCGHDQGPVSASECLMSQVDQNNQEHFFIATQDRNLQNKIIRQPAGAVLFATVNGIQMEMPSEKQKSHVVQQVQRKMMPGEVERQSNMVASDNDRRPSSTGYRSIKRAKGPNPLSMKPKKDRMASGHAHEHDDGTTKKKSGRVRKSRIRTTDGLTE